MNDEKTEVHYNIYIFFTEAKNKQDIFEYFLRVLLN